MNDELEKWLVCTKTPGEFERDELEKKATAFNLPLEKVLAKLGDRPFGEQTKTWRQFVSQMKPQDELWYFATPNEMTKRKMGCGGYAVRRDGRTVASLVMWRT